MVPLRRNVCTAVNDINTAISFPNNAPRATRALLSCIGLRDCSSIQIGGLWTTSGAKVLYGSIEGPYGRDMVSPSYGRSNGP